jgi:hypothetical protein
MGRVVSTSFIPRELTGASAAPNAGVCEKDAAAVREGGAKADFVSL